MDPNEALAQIRALAVRYCPTRRDYRQDAGDLIERITALDEWLTRGGFLPDAWDHSSCQAGPARCDRCIEDIANGADILRCVACGIGGESC